MNIDEHGMNEKIAYNPYFPTKLAQNQLMKRTQKDEFIRLVFGDVFLSNEVTMRRLYPTSQQLYNNCPP